MREVEKGGFSLPSNCRFYNPFILFYFNFIFLLSFSLSVAVVVYRKSMEAGVRGGGRDGEIFPAAEIVSFYSRQYSCFGKETVSTQMLIFFFLFENIGPVDIVFLLLVPFSSSSCRMRKVGWKAGEGIQKKKKKKSETTEGRK
eukprot:TRINITY_DN2145_c6_g1_i1.p1 TRINITY_DN2145_c6_g1~~TRINITY_DN2145_c6_g1_i1.p1  ORF type:complete len:143 (+),score=1.18 TRINITY_DN2145_c6_g1_i1:913-1341(+)